MDLVKAEIARQKKLLLEAKSKNGDKRAFRHTDLVSLQNGGNSPKKPKMGSTNLVNVTTSSPFVDNNVSSNDNEENKDNSAVKDERKLNRTEVIRRLRERNQPVRLFGESDYEAYQRLKRLQLYEPEENGMRNDYMAAMDKVQEAYLQEMFQEEKSTDKSSDAPQRSTGESSGDLSSTTTITEVSIKSDLLNDAELQEMRRVMVAYVDERMNIHLKTPEIRYETDAERYEAHADFVLKFLKHVLSLWGRELNDRSKVEKQSFQGRNASATYTQTVEYIRPLFKKLKNRTVLEDILDSLVKIIALVLDRNYVKAMDGYLELAIGNAPWPLGVTNHGIHSRTAQEKIHAKNVAHVLNDETQRKYIQAIKRLMTHCQRLYPANPSLCVNYM